MRTMHLFCDNKCPKIKKSLLNEMSKNDSYFKALFEIVNNIARKNVKLDTKTKKRLKKYKKLMYIILTRPKSKVKRAKAIKQSGGFLPIVLPIIGTVIAEVLSHVIR